MVGTVMGLVDGSEGMKKTDPMDYIEDMEVLTSDMMETVLDGLSRYDYRIYTGTDVARALQKEHLSLSDYGALLSPAAEPFLEEMAVRAKRETRMHFGNAISLFTPLYLANYCANACDYCGFNCHNHIARGRLSEAEIEQELRAIAQTGLQEILLLTGESRQQSGVDYIGNAILLAKKYFSTVGIEIYPVNTDEYAYLHRCGVDFVSVYQETYDPAVYENHHLSGPKRVYPYRFYAQERAVKGGMRGVNFGVLLGLGDFRRDAFGAGLHASLIQQKYPWAEIGFSVPRMRGYKNHDTVNLQGVGEKQLLQVMLSYRIFMPFAGITISTRERPGFRDHIAGLAATKLSAGVKVGVGGHDQGEKGEAQFQIADSRDVPEIHRMLLKRGLQPIYNDYLSV